MSVEAFARKYTYRADGWPLCPQCGDDELWSRVPGSPKALQLEPGSPDLLDACFREIFSCYLCNWNGRLPHREKGWTLLLKAPPAATVGAYHDYPPPLRSNNPMLHPDTRSHPVDALLVIERLARLPVSDSKPAIARIARGAIDSAVASLNRAGGAR